MWMGLVPVEEGLPQMEMCLEACSSRVHMHCVALSERQAGEDNMG